MGSAKTEKCSLCGGTAHLVAESAPGYREGRTYTIYECKGCFSSFASPLAGDDSIYRHIYKHIEHVPGYNRYHRYALEVLGQKRALDYLGRQEESYWAVGRHLRKRRSDGDNPKILEVGCGLGYFTHALARDGFNVTGVDISPQAVSWAIEHYGPYYANQSLKDLKAQGHIYDAIIMNQLVEHLPDVHAFLAEAVGLLSRGGELILTFPNKSAYPAADWDSDLPPVHLWWFGEEAMKYLANRYDCNIGFVDLGPFYWSHLRIKTPSTPISKRKSIFSAQGELLDHQDLLPASRLRDILEEAKVMPLLRRLKVAVGNMDRWKGPRGQICAAVMRRRR